jgi:hypothetical protein
MAAAKSGEAENAASQCCTCGSGWAAKRALSIAANWRMKGRMAAAVNPVGSGPDSTSLRIANAAA